MGGGSERKESNQFAVNSRNQSAALGTQLTGQGQSTIGGGIGLMKPAQDFWGAMASGDYNKMIQASAPALANITKQYSQARQNITDTMPTGAGRAFGLASLERDRAGASATLLNKSFTDSFGNLAQLGQQQAGIGMQQLGAGLGSSNSAAQQNAQIQQVQQQQKASQLGLIGSLAGAAGGMVTGALGGGSKGASGGGGGGGGFSPTWQGTGNFTSPTTWNIPGQVSTSSYGVPGLPSYATNQNLFSTPFK